MPARNPELAARKHFLDDDAAFGLRADRVPRALEFFAEGQEARLGDLRERACAGGERHQRVCGHRAADVVHGGVIDCD